MPCAIQMGPMGNRFHSYTTLCRYGLDMDVSRFDQDVTGVLKRMPLQIDVQTPGRHRSGYSDSVHQECP